MFNKDQYVRTMTFNIRQENDIDGENGWSYRKEKVSSMIKFHHVDIVGMQEAFYSQIEDLTRLLPEYDYIGVGREDGHKLGEFVPIFYKKDKYELLDSGFFWLSENPDISGSIGWDAACERVTTWGKFLDKQQEQTFYFFNTHFDHVGKVAVVESAYLILDKIKELTDDNPIILTGDFNDISTSEAYKTLISKVDKTGKSIDNFLVDTESISENGHHGPSFTFHDFMANKLFVKEERLSMEDSYDFLAPIDFIFVNKYIKVLTHGILADNWDGKFPSDHMPIVSDIYYI